MVSGHRAEQMRFLRLILLFGVAVAVVAVVRDYVRSRGELESRAVALPSKIPAHLDSTSGSWQYRQQSGADDEVLITAQTFQQSSSDLKLFLGGVELRIERAGGQTYDLITSPEAEFDPKTGNLYSAAEVTVTLGLRIDGADTGKKPTIVRAPEVTFDNNAATCWTDAPARYEFAAGRGRSVGAFYHSGDGYFHMRREAYLERDPTAPGDPLTRVWGDELVYLETDQRVDLKGNVRLEQGEASLRASSAHVFLENGAVSRIEASEASGTRTSPGRVATFAADNLITIYAADQVLERILAEGSARIESETKGGVTRSAANKIHLLYTRDETGTDSYLNEIQLHGGSRVNFDGATADAEQRRLDAEHIALFFRGEDAVLDRIETHSRGRLTLAEQAKPAATRTLDADRITANYTDSGALRYIRAVGDVRTDNRTSTPALRTSSDDFEAEIDPATGATKAVHQWSTFQFKRGEDAGTAADARFTPDGGKILLSGGARVVAPSGTIQAANIQLDQKTGGLVADGQVQSTFVEPQADAPADGVFQQGKPVYATSEHMNRQGEDGPITFRENARLWQESNAIAGNEIVILRDQRVLEAAGAVRTHIASADAQPPVRVESAAMRYVESERQMKFTGDVRFLRGDLTVRSKRLTSWFAEPHADSGASGELEKARAEGDVRIARAVSAAGSRRGFGDTADYDPADESVLLSGAPARAIRADGSETQGARLAYDMSGDRLVVEAGVGERVRSIRQPRRAQ